MDKETRQMLEACNELREIIRTGEYQLVILDEANIATWLKLLPVDDLLDLIDLKPVGVELIFTGRRADPRLIERADLVTEMHSARKQPRSAQQSEEERHSKDNPDYPE